MIKISGRFVMFLLMTLACIFVLTDRTNADEVPNPETRNIDLGYIREAKIEEYSGVPRLEVGSTFGENEYCLLLYVEVEVVPETDTYKAGTSARLVKSGFECTSMTILVLDENAKKKWLSILQKVRWEYYKPKRVLPEMSYGVRGYVGENR